MSAQPSASQPNPGTAVLPAHVRAGDIQNFLRYYNTQNFHLAVELWNGNSQNGEIAALHRLSPFQYDNSWIVDDPNQLGVAQYAGTNVVVGYTWEPADGTFNANQRNGQPTHKLSIISPIYQSLDPSVERINCSTTMCASNATNLGVLNDPAQGAWIYYLKSGQDTTKRSLYECTLQTYGYSSRLIADAQDVLPGSHLASYYQIAKSGGSAGRWVIYPVQCGPNQWNTTRMDLTIPTRTKEIPETNNSEKICKIAIAVSGDVTDDWQPYLYYTVNGGDIYWMLKKNNGTWTTPAKVPGIPASANGKQQLAAIRIRTTNHLLYNNETGSGVAWVVTEQHAVHEPDF